ncbi:EscU/YscU/HrcU family type III secretion system export apparatus switch protein [bacterium]|nr:EscU/YscU/HrcU family type III secretion system export apparatus switch protein [bacterium]
MEGGEKKHEASEQKLKRVRREGQVAKSPVFTQVFQLVGVVSGVFWSLELFWSTSEILLYYTDVSNVRDVGDPHFARWCEVWGRVIWKSVACILLGGLVGTVFGEVLQVGIQVSLKPLAFEAKKVSPLSGCKRLKEQVCSSWLLFVKFLGASTVTFLVISYYADRISLWWLLPSASLAAQSSRMFSTFFAGVVGFWITLAVLERVYKVYRFRRQQRMTDEEVRRESKESDGDPYIRSQRTALHQELAMSEISARVKKARVVIVKRKDVQS